MKKSSVLLFCLFLVFAPLSVSAFTVRNENLVSIPAEETIEDNLYSISQNLTVEGKIDGDLICAAKTLTINGEITGDVICAAETITINGTISGSARIFAESATINGTIARNANIFGNNVHLGESAKISKDLFIVAARGNLRGEIGSDLHGLLGNAIIAGNINRNIFLRLNEIPNAKTKPITIEDGAVVAGSVNYTSGTIGQVSDNAQIAGKVNFNKIDKSKNNEWKVLAAWARLFSTFSALIIGLVLISLWKRKTKDVLADMRKKPGITIAIGAGVMFLTPIISFLLMFTIIGFPLALILLGLWGIGLYISKVLVGIMIGQNVLKKFYPKKKISLFWTMIFGIILTWTFYSIPVIGWSLSLIAAWWGLGGLIYIFKVEEEKKK